MSKFQIMNTNSQYFTPEIEDFFDGYEFRFNHGGVWKPAIFSATDTSYASKIIHVNLMETKFSIENGDIVTEYLTREQIEAEGWRVRKDYGAGTEYKLWVTDQYGDCETDYRLHTRKYGDISDRCDVEIFKDGDRNLMPTKPEPLFVGKCPSVNEFRKITKLIGIKP